MKDQTHPKAASPDEVDYLIHRGNSKLLIVAFSSIHGGIAGLNRFEFVRTLKSSNASVIYIKDVNAAWYQRGIAGVEGGLEGLRNFLLAERSKYETVVTIGYSMGGYGALLFGGGIGGDVSIAIAPQVCLSKEDRERFGDKRWASLIDAFNTSCPPTYLDLTPHLVADQKHVGYVLFGLADRLDRHHLKHLGSSPGARRLRLFGVEDMDHNTCIVPIRQSGLFAKLPDIFQRCVPLAERLALWEEELLGIPGMRLCSFQEF